MLTHRGAGDTRIGADRRSVADDHPEARDRDGTNCRRRFLPMDEDGHLIYQARTDAMIDPSGYTIAGPEAEAALLEHPDAKDRAVAGVPGARQSEAALPAA